MSGWTRGSLSAALKATGVASILGWVLVLSAGPALADPAPDPAPGDPGVVAGPAAGQPLVAPGDDATHQLTVTRNGTVEKTIPMSMGMAAGGHQTANGTYYVQEKMPSVVMDSSTYGVPVNSTYGYKVTVDLAVRFDNSGNFIHSAPWSVDDQGKRDVSHGCINISPSNAKWFFDNFGPGDPVVVKNSSGGSYKKNDGSSDWIPTYPEGPKPELSGAM